MTLPLFLSVFTMVIFILTIHYPQRVLGIYSAVLLHFTITIVIYHGVHKACPGGGTDTRY